MSGAFGFLLFNPASGTAEKHLPADILAELPPGTRLHEFTEGDDPVKLAHAAVAAGARWLAVAGGDGTVEAVASTLIDTSTPLGVIPCGTYNNFARSTGIPLDPLEAARLIRSGATRKMDVGFVNGKPFFECVGSGLDAAIFPLGEEIKDGEFLNWFKLLKTAAKYPRRVFDLSLDRPFREALAHVKSPPKISKGWRRWLKKAPERSIRLRALMVTVSNGPYYGANFAVAPDAAVDDGQLTVTIYKKYNKWELLWHFWSIRSGKRIYAPRVATLKASEIEIGGPEPLETHKDGSLLNEWPLKLRLDPGRLTIFCKSGTESER
jgi:diacylglycerol kinase (ATP)